ncbi:hypothetical protein [Synechococcus phage S-N03]|uniref:Uncharacterized protein n=1 Tax=Synechococcus phage S-N03 TaxID=2718943 RepID=A0A6G8R628_9CAUD|nr:hypothetical protein PQC09_gp233 [Synechococcus phage S-N03]QIN96834.1 hypothetical protein [Synechococcus phage S-N03]
MTSAKRPSNFDNGSTAKAPDKFQAPAADAKKFVEASKAIPSARRNETQIILEDIVPEQVVIETLPSSYRDSFVHPEPVKEEKEAFVYKVPKGYEKFVSPILEDKEDYVDELEVRLECSGEKSWEGIDSIMKSIARKHGISTRKLHDAFKKKHNQVPDEWVRRNDPVTEDVVKTPMEILADTIAASTPKESPADPAVEAILDHKVIQLERALYDTRKLVLEMSQGTIVHGLGVGSPGSGETFVNRMEDVIVPNGEPADGDFLVWDSFMKKWIPSAAVGGGTEPVAQLRTIQRDVSVLINKVASLEEDLKRVAEEQGLFLRLEDSTTGTSGDPIEFTRSEFIDTDPDGDTTRFVVGKDRRGVYTLDGVPQPTVEVPRGDILEFDISGLTPYAGDFVIYANGLPMEESPAHTRDNELIRVNTSHITTDTTKLYYRDANVSGLGWVIVITDY